MREKTTKVLKQLGENIEIRYTDRGFIDHIFESKKGHDALIPLLSNPGTVFKYQIIRKLSEEGKTKGAENRALAALQEMTRFDYYTNNFRRDVFEKTDHAIYAIAGMKNKACDDFLHTLMGHPNVMYRNNDLFEYQNHECSDYLRELMKTPPETREVEDKLLTINELSSPQWVPGVNINGMSWSPDGKHLAVAGYEKTSIFSAQGKEEKILTDRGNALDIDYHLAGKLVAVGFQDGYLHIYNTQTGELIDKLEGHSGGIKGLKFSPDGNCLASVSNDKTLIIREVPSSKILNKFSFNFELYAVAWTSDSKVIIGSSKNICVVDLDKNKKGKMQKFGSAEAVQILEKEKDHLIAVGGKSALTLYNKTLKPIQELAQKNVCRIRFSADKNTMYTTCCQGEEQGLWAWDLETYKNQKCEGYAGGSARGMDIHPQAGDIYIGGIKNVIQYWNKDLSLQNTLKAGSHTGAVNNICYSKKHDRYYTTDLNGVVMSWDKEEKSSIVSNGKKITSIGTAIFSNNEDNLYIGSGKQLIIVAIESGKVVHSIDMDYCNNLMGYDDKILVTSGRTIYLLDDKGKVLQNAEYTDQISNAAILSKQKLFVGGKFLDKKLTFWNLEKVKETTSLNVPVEDHHGLYHITTNDNESLLYTSGADGVIRVYDTKTRQITKELRENEVAKFMFCNTKDNLFFTIKDNLLTVYELSSLKQLAHGKTEINITAFYSGNKTTLVGLQNGKILKIKF